jgi:hypothetical protein
MVITQNRLCRWLVKIYAVFIWNILQLWFTFSEINKRITYHYAMLFVAWQTLQRQIYTCIASLVCEINKHQGHWGIMEYASCLCVLQSGVQSTLFSSCKATTAVLNPRANNFLILAIGRGYGIISLLQFLKNHLTRVCMSYKRGDCDLPALPWFLWPEYSETVYIIVSLWTCSQPFRTADAIIWK